MKKTRRTQSRTAALLAIAITVVSPAKGRGNALTPNLKRLPYDTAKVVTSPLRANRRQWMAGLLAGGALSATLAYDGTLRDRLIPLRRWSGQDDFRHAGDLLQFAGLALGAGQMSYGWSKGDTHSFDNGWVQLEGGATAASIGAILKWVVGRGRPGGNDPDYFKPFSSNGSFPSGHTLMAFTAAEIASRQYPSLWVQAPAFLTASAVGLSRIAADKHWAGDVLAGAFLGMGIGHAIVTAHHSSFDNWRLLAMGNKLEIGYVF